MNNESRTLSLVIVTLFLLSSQNSPAQSTPDDNDLRLILTCLRCEATDIRLIWILENNGKNPVKLLDRWWNAGGGKVNNINFFTLNGNDTIWLNYYNPPLYPEITNKDFKIVEPHGQISDYTPQLSPYTADTVIINFPWDVIYAFAIYSTEDLNEWDCWKGTLKSNTISFIYHEVYDTHPASWQEIKQSR